MKTMITTCTVICCLLTSAMVIAEELPDASELETRVRSLLDSYALADDFDKNLLAKRSELEALGERAYPALCKLLGEAEDPVYMGRLVNVFLRSSGDKAGPLEAVRRLLRTRRDGRYANAHVVALQFLAEHGTREDLDVVGECASTGGPGIRAVAEKAKVQIEARWAHERDASGDAVKMRTMVKSLLEEFARSEGLIDERALAKRTELEALGAKTYAVLCDILEESADPNYMARIVDVFIRSEGDKARPLEAVRKLLMTRREERFIPAQQAALRLLAEYGTSSDIPLIEHYAASGYRIPRALAVEAKKNIEARTAQQRIPPAPQRSDETSKAINSPAK